MLANFMLAQIYNDWNNFGKSIEHCKLAKMEDQKDEYSHLILILESLIQMKKQNFRKALEKIVASLINSQDTEISFVLKTRIKIL